MGATTGFYGTMGFSGRSWPLWGSARRRCVSPRLRTRTTRRGLSSKIIETIRFVLIRIIFHVVTSLRHAMFVHVRFGSVSADRPVAAPPPASSALERPKNVYTPSERSLLFWREVNWKKTDFFPCRSDSGDRLCLFNFTSINVVWIFPDVYFHMCVGVEPR